MLERISEHIWRFPCEDYSDRPNIGYIAGTKAALLFDAGNSDKHAELIRADLRNLGLKMPDYVALSHWHWDHSFGLHAWNAVTIAGGMTNDKLREMSGWEWTEQAERERLACRQETQFCVDMKAREYPNLADVTVCPAAMEFTGEMSIDLGGVSCRLIHAAGPHSEDSVICYIPEDGFVFLGDSNGKDLYGLDWKFDIAHEEELVPTLAALPYDPEKLFPYRALLEQLPFTACIGGHAGLMTRDELLATLKI